jgi:uncharacterized protein YbjQ (UPF0145 family)
MAWGQKVQRIEAENKHIAVVTSSVCRKFEVIDSVHELASQDRGLYSADLQSIFEMVKNKLRAKCVELGGDAVLNCHFSERSAGTGGLLSTQVIEMWAYGTIVKFTE